MGVDVHPILPLAKADPLSSVIVESLVEAERIGGSRFRRSGLEIRGTELVTPFSAIIRQGSSRAVLNEFSPTLMSPFREHVDRQVAHGSSARARPDIVLIGHVHADRVKPKRGANACPGLERLAAFERRETLHPRDAEPTRTVTDHDLFLIDRAFDH